MNYELVIESIIESIRAVGVNQVYYSRFGVERGNVKYPAIILTTDNILRNNNGVNTITLGLTYLEQYTSGDQILSIQNRGIQSIVYAINYMYDNSMPGYMIGQSQDITFIPFLDQFSDQCAGVTTTLTVVYADNIGECTVTPCK